MKTTQADGAGDLLKARLGAKVALDILNCFFYSCVIGVQTSYPPTESDLAVNLIDSEFVGDPFLAKSGNQCPIESADTSLIGCWSIFSTTEERENLGSGESYTD